MSIRPLAQQVDERLADLTWADYVLATERGRIEQNIRHYAGQERDWRSKTWSGTLEEALAATPESWNAARFEQAKADHERNLAASTQIMIEVRELNACYRDYYWNRAFLVKNNNGHVHKSQDCSTCFDSTQFAWLTEFSGANEDEIVEAAGETACTVCYPSAPAEVLNRPTTIVTAEKAAKEAAKAEREAAKAERDAKRRAKAPTASGEPLLLPNRYGNAWMEEIQTERTARMEWNDAEEDLAWAEFRQDRRTLMAERQRLIEEALAEKYGVSPQEMRDQLAAKYAKRRRS